MSLEEAQKLLRHFFPNDTKKMLPAPVSNMHDANAGCVHAVMVEVMNRYSDDLHTQHV